MPQQARETIRAKLTFLYGPEEGQRCYARLVRRLDGFRVRSKRRAAPGLERLTERDVVLITYGNLLKSPETTPLATLVNFLNAHLKGVVSTVHVLPFFPYSSDDGFSVIDFREVSPELGSWDDIRRLKRNFKLMVDAVVNHVSAQSPWFRGFLKGEEKYRDYFITVDPSADLSAVVRPRASPLLTPVQAADGQRHVWTTFSADQIDLNYANPEVLLEVVDVLLFYIEQGADIIRLDAIAYLWKDIGTPCIHLPQTHAVVQLFRAIVDWVAPWVSLITETNVPHRENVSYFGDGTDEAHLVYQFPLPPLVAHALLTGSARYLSRWAGRLAPPQGQTSFFNFTASHDGIGLLPVSGILGADEIEDLIARTRANGGDVSFRANSDGSTSPYELNITYFDLLNSPASEEPLALQVRRFLASQAIVLALAGVPGIYLHSLLGSRNNLAGVAETGQPRSINREKLDVRAVEAALADASSRQHAVFNSYKALIQKRTRQSAFHPGGGQRVLSVGEEVFALLRTSPAGDETLIALHNVSNKRQMLALNLRELGLHRARTLRDVVSDGFHRVEQPGTLVCELEPYQFAWLKP